MSNDLQILLLVYNLISIIISKIKSNLFIYILGKENESLRHFSRSKFDSQE